MLGQLFDTMITENVVTDEDDVTVDEFEAGGIGLLASELETALETSYAMLDAFDRAVYYERLEALIETAATNNQIGAVQQFYEKELTTPTRQILVQRMMNPMAGQYLEYLIENPEITDRNELEEYAEIYREVAGLYEKLIAQLVAVVRISNGKDSDYEHLSSMSLNNLMQKVDSKNYREYNVFADGFDRQIRNSLAHTEYAVNSVDENITFLNRGEEVAVLSYQEFQVVVLEGLLVTYSLWHLQLMILNYYIGELRGVVANQKTDQERS